MRTRTSCRIPALLFLMFLAFTPSLVYSAEPCAKVSEISGAECEKLKVKMDLSGCQLTPPVREAAITCNKSGTASARVYTPDAILRVTLKREPAAWGKTAWAAAGPVVSTPRKTGPTTSVMSPVPTPPIVPEVEIKAPAPPTEALDAIVPAQPPKVEPPAVAEQPLPPSIAIEPPPTVTEAPATFPTVEKSPLSVGGSFDFYYAYNFARPNSNSIPSTTSAGALPSGNNGFRYYDLYHNQLALNLAELTLQHEKEDASILLDFDFGQMADYNAFSSYSTPNATDEVSKHIGQAFVVYHPKAFRWFTLSVGKMATHIGLEVIKAKDNWQYSRSFLFSYGIPLWHSGVSFGFALIPQRLSTTLYVYNGWNSVYDNNESKSVGAQLRWTPSENFFMTYNFLTGPEKASNEGDLKTIHELNSVWSLSQSVSLAVDLLHGAEDHVTIGTQQPKLATWTAGSVALKYVASNWYYLSPRYEHFKDNHGYIFSSETNPDTQSLDSYTLTNGFALTPSFELRLEGRHDISTREDKFTSRNAAKSKTQTTLALAALYQF